MQEKNNIKQEHQYYCRYYQAHVVRQEAWFFVAIVRSYEHMMFDRTLDAQTSIFEFFVPADMEQQFLKLMALLASTGVIENLHFSDNRLIDPLQVV